MDHSLSDIRPLAGIRVFDMGLGVAGPLCSRYLAHYGAEVVKVESRANPDTHRQRGTHWLSPNEYGRELWGDTGPGLNENNSSKLSVGLNMKTPEGLAAAKRLLAKCDVFLSNLSPRAIKGLGMDYESVRAAKPDIIHILLTGYGSSPGPYSSYVAWGKNLLSLTGLDDLTGYPDRTPAAITGMAYADETNCLHGVMAVLGALEHRQRTGEGQAIDLSQFEATVGLLGPIILDYGINGRTTKRTGNRLEWTAPQGVYPCQGNDRWVAITVTTEDEWLALCLAAGHPEWAEDSRFQTVQNRLAHHDELDEVIGAWTSGYDNTEIAERLQRAGVAAAPVLPQAATAVDPQLATRGHWILGDSAHFGKDLFTNFPIHLTDTPCLSQWAAPLLGEDNDYVLGELCGYSEAEIQEMTEKGAVYPAAMPEVKLQRPYLQWIRHFMPNLPWPDFG